MENVSNQQQKQIPHIKVGEYDFYIQGVVRQDGNGYDLKTSKGNKYEKLRLIILDKEESHSVYKMIFGKRDIEEIVKAIGNPVLTHVFEVEKEDFDSETLIGEKGRLLMGRRFHNGNNYPQVECFLKPRPKCFPIVDPVQNLAQELDSKPTMNDNFEDDVPF